MRRKQKQIPVLFKTSKAFSLIEILFVLLIIAFIFALASQKLIRKGKKVKTTFDKMIRLNKRLVILSKLHNQTYRWVIKLDPEGKEQYWVEKKQTRKKKGTGGGKNLDSHFFMDKSFYPEPESIPSILNITKVESPFWAKAKTKGLIYIYYYPQGLAQETRFYFTRPDNQAVWTLYLDPASKNIQVLKKGGRLGK